LVKQSFSCENFSIAIVDFFFFTFTHKTTFSDQIRLIFSICENIPFKRQFKEENSHVFLLIIDSGFTIDNIAGLYCPFKIEISETAFSKAKIQISNITDFLQDSYMNQFLGDINHNNNVQTSIKTSIKHQSCG
jgi:hypothetical protein